MTFHRTLGSVLSGMSYRVWMTLVLSTAAGLLAMGISAAARRRAYLDYRNLQMALRFSEPLQQVICFGSPDSYRLIARYQLEERYKRRQSLVDWVQGILDDEDCLDRTTLSKQQLRTLLECIQLSVQLYVSQTRC
jgi:hypothetical protein